MFRREPGPRNRSTVLGVTACVCAALGVAVLVGLIAARPTRTIDAGPLNRAAASANASAAASRDLILAARRTAFIGDSYTVGAGASAYDKKWTALLARKLGWVSLPFGEGSTGYVMTGGTQGNFPDRVPQVAAAGPGRVFVSGGRNDMAEFLADPAKVTANIRRTFIDLRAALPNAEIIAMGFIWDDDPPPPAVAEVGELVRGAVSAVGGRYIDPGQPLVGHPEWIIADGIHPNDLGQIALTDAIVKALATN